MPPKATNARKAAPRPPAGVPNFDAKVKKGKRFKFWAFGREWTVKAPNQQLAANLFDSGDDDTESIATGLTKFLASFIVGEQRLEFVKAMGEAEDFGPTEMSTMMEMLSEVTSPDIPT